MPHLPHHIDMPPICHYCARLRPRARGQWGLFCDAFPDGIPETIIQTQVDHRKPYPGDHDLQFLARSPRAEQEAARLVAEAHVSPYPALGNLDSGDNDWLYAWGDLPTTLDGLRARLRAEGISAEDFRNSARYEANEDRFPWLKDL